MYALMYCSVFLSGSRGPLEGQQGAVGGPQKAGGKKIIKKAKNIYILLL